MARRSTPAKPEKREPALLSKPREEVRAQIISRIEIGNEIVDRQPDSATALEQMRSDFRKWDDYNSEFLRRAFTGSDYADEYGFYSSVGVILMRERSFWEEVDDLRQRATERRNRLVSIVERLDLIDEDARLVTGSQKALPVSTLKVEGVTNNKVFVVHGQDDETKAVVARFISGCGLEPVILHEQANGGRTIIEKFETEADVGFAVILMTADDVGGRRRGDEIASDDLKPRARQNVVLELGYFLGRLGRSRVAALKRGDIELPSDFAGVVWTPIDAADGWKLSLARELKNAGFEFDIAKALGI